MRILAAIVLISVVAVTGCASNAETAQPEETETGFDREQELERRMAVRRELGNKLPPRAPDESGAPVVGEVPDSILSAAREDLALKLDISPDAIEVRQAAAVLWSDGSLGCPRPDEVYTQAQIPGFRIVLAYGDREYDYRATEGGFLMLCELPTLPQRPEGI
jgi:hypothetical protein